MVYCGRVGTGFDDDTLRDLHRQLEKLKRDASPLDSDVPTRERKEATWVEPTLVAEIEFNECDPPLEILMQWE